MIMETASAETILAGISGILTVVAILTCVYVTLKKILVGGMDGKLALTNMIYYAPVIALISAPLILLKLGTAFINVALSILKMCGFSV